MLIPTGDEQEAKIRGKGGKGEDPRMQGGGGAQQRAKHGMEKGDKQADKVETTAVYCQECQAWLNGPRQWEDHKIGKKHRKNVQKDRQGKRDTAAKASPKKEVKPDPEPEGQSDMWDWLEAGKKDKLEKEKQAAVESQPVGDEGEDEALAAKVEPQVELSEPDRATGLVELQRAN